MLLTAFIYGLLAASLALIVEIAGLDMSGGLQFSLSQPHLADFIPLFLVVLIEEGCRFLLLTQYTRRFFALNPQLSLQNIALSGLFFGLGFATLELVMIIEETGHQNYPLLPLYGIIITHTVLSILYILSLGKRLRFSPWLALVFGIILHLTYNIFLASE